MPKSIHILGARISGAVERFCIRLVNSLAERSKINGVNPESSPTTPLSNRVYEVDT